MFPRFSNVPEGRSLDAELGAIFRCSCRLTNANPWSHLAEPRAWSALGLQG